MTRTLAIRLLICIAVVMLSSVRAFNNNFGLKQLQSVNRLHLHRQFSSSNKGLVTEKLVDTDKFINSIDIFIFDCDGVIWKGDSVIKGIPAVLDKLRKLGKKIYFVTNNSTKSR